jgi:hypothetical protein
MTNKTVTLSRELAEQILAELTSGAVSIGTGAKVRAALADPVQSADGAPEVIARFIEHCGEGGGVAPNREGDLCEYRHVVRLQAEVERYKNGALQQVCDHLNKKIDALQAELTKARKLFVRLLPLHGYSNGLIVDVNDFMSRHSAQSAKLYPTAQITSEVAMATGANQSAPAAKDGE